MPRRGRGIDRRGDSKSGPPFAQLPFWLLDCPAYRGLSLGARETIVALLRRFNGHNNGEIALGERDAGKWLGRSSREAVRGYFAELVAAGFIECTRKGSYSMKVRDRRASEWRLTWLESCDSAGRVIAPDKPFMRPRPADGPLS